MKIWIDLDNSPHVPLFVPIIEELRARGHQVMITARDAFQVRELADLHGLDYKLVGHHYGKHFLLKMLGVFIRGFQLLPAAIRERPTIAVSHGSRSQLVVSVFLGIPSLVIADYEFAKAWAGITPTWVMVPKVIPTEAIHIDPDRVLHYPGIKEDVYVSRFRLDPHLRTGLGVGADDVMVTIRPPATEAHYHNPEAEELLREAVEHLSSHPGVRMVMVPRNDKQAEIIRTAWPALVESSRIIFPERVVDGLNLIWHSDLVISGGGTMNREAAALGVPVYSIFRGPLGAVDRFLAGEQRLVVLTSAEEVRSKVQIERRARHGGPPVEAKRALGRIVEHIEFILASGSRELASTRAK
jgi:uncharacterized protein